MKKVLLHIYTFPKTLVFGIPSNEFFLVIGLYEFCFYIFIILMLLKQRSVLFNTITQT